ncbi:MAG: type II toxin-antitoxin system HicB family antitoxin [Planctomycetota bacterium]|nr:type II toxin-antitoxin system HicB family antitoxin [Planctomycetota bacterium]
MSQTIESKTLGNGSTLTLTEFEAGTVTDLAVVLVEEVDGGFSAIGRDLPGLVSQGETIEEAMANIKEAFEALRESYREYGEEIPWENFSASESGVERRILIDAD